MTAKLNFKIDDSRFRKKMQEIDSRFKDPTLALNTAKAMLNQAISESFESQKSAVSGTAWAPLSTKTKRSRTGGVRMLQDTGALRAGSVATLNGKDLAVGTTVPYGGFQQRGTKNMPAREYLPIPRSGPLSAIKVWRDVIAMLKSFFIRGTASG